MRALVTGSAGFIGRHITRGLRAAGWHVAGLDIAEAARPTLPYARVDCRDFFRRTDQYFDLVVHCAAMVDGREAIDGKPALLGAYNLQLDGALFEWALRTRPGRIVYFSSSAAYPIALQLEPGHRLREHDIELGHPQTPDATYGWVKLTGEQIIHNLRHARLPVTVVRPFSGYGDDQEPCYPFPAMIARAARHDSPFDVWGDGQQIRDFIHVNDIVSAVLTLVDAGIDGPVNLGTGRATSMDELARLAMRAAGYQAPIRHLAHKPAGLRYRVADPSQLHRYFQHQVTLEEGIDRALSAAADR